MTDTTPIEIGFVCPRTGRVAVSLSEFARSEFNGETNSYIYSQSGEEFGLDPWAMIDSIDVPVEGNSFDLWMSSGSYMPDMSGEIVIFVRSSIAHALKEARS